jgi:hypothetical protein
VSLWWPAVTARSACEPWVGVQPPNPGGLNDDVLEGVNVLSGCNAWAVGLYRDSGTLTYHSLIVRWNGSSWQQVNSPNPDAATSDNQFFGVTATSPRNAWAVGLTQQVSANVESVLIARWNGRSWRQQPSPALPPDNALFSVAATSARDAWAVGTAFPGALIEHWNGTRWSVAHIQGHRVLQGGVLAGVAATSARDAWAAGTLGANPAHTLLVHWNGTTWRRVPSPNPAGPAGTNIVRGIAATAPGNAWAVGVDTSAAHYRTMVLHWNGHAWKVVPSPNPAGPAAENVLFAVTAPSKNDAWAVGDTFTQNGNRALLVLHWNGRTWHNVPVTSTPGNEFTGVNAFSAGNVWIVADQAGNPGIRTLALHCR